MSIRVPSLVIPRYGGADVFEIEEIELPVPGAGEVFVRVAAAGVNFAEVFCRLGLYKHAPPPPFVPGFEFAGTVEAVGDGVALAIGTPVLGVVRFGGYQGGIVIDARRVRPIPAGWTMAEAAAFPAAALTAAYGLLEPGNLRQGETIVVHSAAGGVGSMAVQLAKALGAQVVGTVGSDHKLQVLEELGCDVALNYKEGNWAAAVKESVGSVDVVFDALGGRYLRDGYDLLGRRGRLISYGLGTMTPRGNRPNPFRLFWQYLQIPRFSVFPLISDNKLVAGFNVLLLWDDLAILGELMNRCMTFAEQGKMRPRVSQVVPYDRVADVHRALQSGTTTGKMVLSFSSSTGNEC